MDYAQLKRLEFRRKFWKIAGQEVFIIDPTNKQEVGYVRMREWRLHEDIRIFTGRAMQSEIVQIHARLSGDEFIHEVLASDSLTPLFALQRRKQSRFFRQHWDIMDTQGKIIGAIQETSSNVALYRRWLERIPVGNIVGLLFWFWSRSYHLVLLQPNGSETVVGSILHRKNPAVVVLRLDTSMAPVGTDPRLPLAATTLLIIADAVLK